MCEFQGLIDAEVFLGASALFGGSCLWFNRRLLAGMAMACVLVGFTGVVFNRHIYEGETYIAAPTETLYHVAECIHAPRGKLIATFESERKARHTGRIPCRCVNGKQNVMAGVTRPANR